MADGSVSNVKSVGTGIQGINHLHSNIAKSPTVSGNMWTRGDRVPESL